MTATAWKSATYGVRVGASNAAKFFKREWKSIQVEIDGEFHEFRLPDTFWTTCPEFRGNVVKKWLLRHGLAPWPYKKPPRLEVVPLGGNRFRLSKPA